MTTSLQDRFGRRLILLFALLPGLAGEVSCARAQSKPQVQNVAMSDGVELATGDDEPPQLPISSAARVLCASKRLRICEGEGKARARGPVQPPEAPQRLSRRGTSGRDRIP